MDLLHTYSLPASPIRFFHVALTALGSIFILLLRSLVSPASRKAPKVNEDFDIDYDTGFMPSTAIERLPPAFDFWETSLAQAHDCLALANDETPAALAKRERGAEWRQRIRDVSAPIALCGLTRY